MVQLRAVPGDIQFAVGMAVLYAVSWVLAGFGRSWFSL